MCFGIPMQITESDGIVAAAKAGDMVRRIDLALIGPQPVGTHVLVYINSAVRTLDAVEAAQITDAISAVSAAADGAPFEHLIADLVDRDPELPAHLKPAAKEAAE